MKQETEKRIELTKGLARITPILLRTAGRRWKYGFTQKEIKQTTFFSGFEFFDKMLQLKRKQRSPYS